MTRFYKIILAGCLGFILFPSMGSAQVSTYGFYSSTTTYTPITGGTVLGDASTDEQRFVDPAAPLGGATTTGPGFQIGFNFVFNGNDNDVFSLNANGWITLGSSTLTPAVNNIGVTTNPLGAAAVSSPVRLRDRISGFGSDILASATGSIQYLTQGTAPNRTLTVQWSDYTIASTTTAVNFQIILHETSNVVEIVYGTCTTDGSGTVEVGLGGDDNTDYNNRKSTTSWSNTNAGTAAGNKITFSSTVSPASGLQYMWAPVPETPAAITENPGASCSAGAVLTYSGAPENPDITWYWHTSPTGTGTTNSGATYTVTANGTYYLRAYNASTDTWSDNSSSFTVADIPVATTPPAPTAAANPACMSTTLTMPSASGIGYFWQTAANQTATTSPATTPLPVTSSGTYYVAAYDSTAMCWSQTSSLAVTIGTFTPQAPVAPAMVYACVNDPSVMVTADPAASSGSAIITLATNYTLAPGSEVTLNGMLDLPPGATVTSSKIKFNGVTTSDLTYPSDITFDMSGALSFNNNTIANVFSEVTNAGPYNRNLTYNNPGAFTMNFQHGYAEGGPAIFASIVVTVTYTIPPSTITWYDAATSGTVLGTGSPFEAVGTTVLPNTATEGIYPIYAASVADGCVSPTTTVNIAVSSVNVPITQIPATCNGAADGSFSVGTALCGNTPFTYSVDGGAYVSAIPTDLGAGPHTILVQDMGGNISAPISITVTEPTAPQGLTATATFYTASLDWTPQGSETDWVIEYGPAGFTPGSGTQVTASTHPFTISGLTNSSSYDFYVRANCVDTSDFSTVFTFNTQVPFVAWDNQCGPAFIDISGTATPIDFSVDSDEFFEDEAEVLVTSDFPISFNGVTSTDVTVGVNGGVVLGGTAASEVESYMTEADAGTANIYAWNEDLDLPTGGIYAQTIGTAPNRQFVVMYNDIPPYLESDGFTFEIIFEESNGDVYFVYQDKTSAEDDFETLAYEAEIGVTGESDIMISDYDSTYLSANNCVHFYGSFCPNITSVNAMLYADEADLDWSAGLYGETEWTIIYGPEGFDPTATPSQAYDTIIVNSPGEVQLTGLTQLTTYDVYIYSECSADGLESSGYFYEFTTLPLCADPTNLDIETDVDSLELTWDYTANSGYDPTAFKVQYDWMGFGLGSGTMATANGVNAADTIHDASLMGGGVYDVYIQATCGTDTSNWVGPVTVTMPLTNDLSCAPDTLMVGQSGYVFNNTGATVTTGEDAIAPPATGAQTTTGWTNNTLNKTTWFMFQAPASGSVRINSTAIEYNNQVAVYTAADCSVFSTYELVAANDNEIDGPSVASNFTVCGLTPGQYYYLMNDAFNSSTGNYSLYITPIVLEAGMAEPLTKICSGAEIDLFTTISGNDANGTWSSPLPAVSASISNGNLNSAGLGYTTYDLQYRVTDGCAYDSIVSQVQVFRPSQAGTDGTLTVCKHATVSLYTGLQDLVDIGGTWYDPSNAPITGSQITASGFPGSYNYDYIVNNGVCPNDTSNVIVVVLSSCDALGLDEAALEGVNVYPNPSTGLVYISSDVAESFDLRVTDVNGRLISEVKAGVTNASIAQVDLGKAERGVYLIHLGNSSAEKTYRIVLQ